MTQEPAAPLEPGLDGKWALILGASSGFGAAAARAFANAGMNVFGVHLDRRGTQASVDAITGDIEAAGRQAVFFNMNAADETKRRAALDEMRGKLDADGGESSVRILMHSLAFGTLGPYVPTDGTERRITQRQLEMTLDVMANSLVYWTQEMIDRDLLVRGSKLYGMTSAGDARVIPQYAAVSAAKATLGSHLRQLAVELAPLGIAANAIKAGVTQTPALEKIPSAKALLDFAQDHNPSGRVTTPEDVAETIIRLSIQDSNWLTGNTINVDGGEDIVVV